MTDKDMTEKDINRIAKQSAKKLGLPSRRMRLIITWLDSRWWDLQYFYIIFTDKLIDLSYKLHGKKRKIIN